MLWATPVIESQIFCMRHVQHMSGSGLAVHHTCCGGCRVRDFEVIDSFPFGVEFTWEKDGAPHTETLFKRAGPIPSTKMLTFFRYTLIDSIHAISGICDISSRQHGLVETGPYMYLVACQIFTSTSDRRVLMSSVALLFRTNNSLPAWHANVLTTQIACCSTHL